MDGNDSIEKSSFKLSPAAARVSSSAPKTKKKPAQKAKPSSPRKRLFNSHQSSVSEVSDLRIHKRGRINKDTHKDEDCIVVDSDSDIEDPHSLNEREQKKTGGQLVTVTPSPHPSRRQSHQQQQQPSNATTPLYNSSKSSSLSNKQQGKKSSHFANKSNGKSRAVRNTTSSWFQQKKQQKTSQSSAFNSPKENPFSTYSFDPNSIEKNLDSQAVRSKEPSIFPSTVAASNFTATKARNNRTFRTPANRRKSSSSSRISSHDLLARKANELNQHRHQTMTKTGYNGNHDGASQMSAFTAGNGFAQEHSFGNYEQDYLASSGSVMTSYQEQFGQPSSVGVYGHLQPRPGTAGTRVQHFMQPQQRSLQPHYHEGSFDEGYSGGGYDFPPRPGTSSSRFMNMPYQQEFVPPRSVGGYDFPPCRPGTSSSRFTNMAYPQQFVQPQQSGFQPTFGHQMYHEDSFDQFSQQHHGQQQLNRFESNFHHDGVGQVVSKQAYQQMPQMHRPNAAQVGMSSSQNGHMSGATGENPYLQQESSRAAASLVNPYRRQTQDANSHTPNYNAAHVGMSSSKPVQNPYLQHGSHRAAGNVINNPYMRQDANSSGPPMEEVVVEAMHDENTSQFEDAFF